MSSLSSLPTNSGASQRTTPNAAPVPPAKPYDLAIHACKALAAACASNPVADAAHTLGKFSSAAVPAIALDRYAAHLAARMEHGEAGILLGLCLIMRVWRTHRAAPSPDTLHRLLLTATTVAMKAHFDDFYVNKYMARIGGLETPKELGELEAHMFLTLLGGTATVRQKEIRATLDNGLVVIGHEFARKKVDAAGTTRLVGFLLDGDIKPLEPFDAYVQAQQAQQAAMIPRTPSRHASPLSLSPQTNFLSATAGGSSTTPQRPRGPDSFGVPGVSDDVVEVPQQLASFHEEHSFGASTASPANARPWPGARPDQSQSGVYVSTPSGHGTHLCVCGGIPRTASASAASGLWSGSIHNHSRLRPDASASSVPAVAAGSATMAIRAARSATF
jgi:hypothetical protein